MSVHVVIVTGSREATDRPQARGALTVVHALWPDAVLFSGNCPPRPDGTPGFDRICEEIWAELCGYDDIAAAVAAGCARLFPADWNGPCGDGCPDRLHRVTRWPGGREYCPVAGNRRNQRMVDEGLRVARLEDITAIAMKKPGAANKGTTDCVRCMERAGIRPVKLTDSTTAGGMNIEGTP